MPYGLFMPMFSEAGLEHCFRSFGFELQGRSAFTSWRARKRDPKTFSLAAHNQELILGHVTFVLQQLFQISLERGLCFSHRIERLLHRSRQIVCIDVLPLQFFPCHCLAPTWSDEKAHSIPGLTKDRPWPTKTNIRDPKRTWQLAWLAAGRLCKRPDTP